MSLTQSEYIFGAILLFVATLSIISSILSLYLIHAINRWNGFVVIIYSMTICQMIYDFTFFFVVDYQDNSIEEVIVFTSSFGGLSVTFWTNILSGVVLVIVLQQMTIDIRKMYPWFWSGAVIPPLIFASCQIATNNYYFEISYNVIRFVSIAFNLFVYVFVRYKLLRLPNQKSSAVSALRELSSRLKYYPIVQVITRTPAVCYQFAYGFGTTTFGNQTSFAQSVGLGFYAAFIPSAGIGYFLIFVIMQPYAKAHLKMLFVRCVPEWLWSVCCCCLGPYHERLLSNSSSGTNSTVVSRQASFLNAQLSSPFHQKSGNFDTMSSYPPIRSSLTANNIRDSNLTEDQNWNVYRDVGEMDEDELCLRAKRTESNTEVGEASPGEF